MSKKPRYDLRNFWPWYERQWTGTNRGTATRSPFRFSDLHETEPLRAWERRFWQAVSIMMVVGLLTLVLWGLFRP
jgi:hypothetical protein